MLHWLALIFEVRVSDLPLSELGTWSFTPISLNTTACIIEIKQDSVDHEFLGYVTFPWQVHD